MASHPGRSMGTQQPVPSHTLPACLRQAEQTPSAQRSRPAARSAATRREPGEGPHSPPHMGRKVHGRAVPPHRSVATDCMRGAWPVP